MYRKCIKRILDFTFSLILLPFVLLEVIIIGPIIYLEDRGTIFYMAKRRGLNGKIFNMIKLRSMKMNSKDIRNEDNSTFNSSNDSRVTKIGRFLRKTSLDEVTQILNIIKGDMSFIGPRAPVPIDGVTWDDLNDFQRKRLAVRPGITGYAASLYRNSIDKEKKLKLDCFYSDHVSLLLDVKILFWTVKTVLLRKNLYTNEPDKKGCTKNG